ncbi:Mitochondrial import receptor subunit TOM40-like protein 1 [Armadillidium nasatum]|uniref:Mitochondrial import receptor subunit TOM40-like protein 1 n=1 Tax=Armadillidium nasatum TaxID=96803 RepID=A0A5N5TFT7_9CRUS|nr:Mitochondrial import receptor subunit TOM40-like protein 1 [Armadillidium nasatum]
MGNVLASSPGFSSPLPTSPIPPSPTIPGQGDKEASQSSLEPPVSDGLPGVEDAFPNNPGTMEDLHKKCKDVFPVVFEGGKFMLNKPISNHFQVAHTLNFSSIQPSGYKFSATYVGMKQTGPAEAYPVLLGEIDPSGNLSANMIHQFTPNLKGKVVAQIQQSKCQATQMSADWRGSDYTASLTLGNIDIVNDFSGVIVGHYLQKITPKLDLGAEIAYQRGPQVPGGHIAVHSMAGRYTGDKYVASGTIGGAGLHLCYYRKASETLQFGVELESSAKMQESTASFAYQVDIPKANFTFRGTVDTNWTIGAVIEKKLMPLPFTFALSAVHNYPKNQFKLGCGFIVG